MADRRSVELAARAKVNFRLRVLGRDEDGYHGVESVFARLELADRLELEVGGEPGIRLEVEGEDASTGGLASVPEGPGNLVWRAVDAFHREVGAEPSVTARLHKRIPAGAGLGGGSADAAAALRGLDELAGGVLDGPELLRLAGEIGADVPFLAADLPMAVGWERGRRLMPLPAPSPRPVLVAVPEVRIGAAEAYGWLDEDRAPPTPDREDRGDDGGQTSLFPADGALPGTAAPAGAALLPPAGSWSEWPTVTRLAGNDFEAAVFARFPELGWWKEELEGEGAEPALLCGSGSALLGVFAEPERRDAAARRLEAAETVRVLRTRGPV